MAGLKGFRERLQDGDTILCAEGYSWELERRGFVQAGCFTPEAVLEHPDRVTALHEEFALAGSDIIVAYTYYGHREKLKQIGRVEDLETLNLESLRLAREVADKYGKLMAGNLSLTTTFDPDDKDSINKAASMFKEQVEWAVKGKADLIIAETFMDLAEALLALQAIKAYGNGVPAVVTMSPLCPDKTADDVTWSEALRQLEQAGADVVGFNCQRGPATMLPLLREARRVCKGPLAALPVPYRTNEKEKTFVSLTDPATGQSIYPLDLSCVECSRSDIRQFAEEAKELGIQYVGLCCGCAPNSLRVVAEVYGRETEASAYSPDLSHSFCLHAVGSHQMKIAQFMKGTTVVA